MNKRNIALLGLLVVLILILLLSRGRENIEKRVNLFRVKEAQITRIEIIQNKPQMMWMMEEEEDLTVEFDILAIVREGDRWMIESPRRFPARQTTIERFFTNFYTLTIPNNSITENVDRHAFYGVDENSATKVNLYGRRNKLVGSVFVGRGQNPSFSYIRRVGENDVFQVDNIFHHIDPRFPSFTNWREDRILDITDEDIISISVARDIDPFELTRDGAGWNKATAAGTVLLDNPSDALTRFIGNVVNLRTTVFFDDEFPMHESRLETPIIELFMTLANKDELHLKIARIDDNALVLQRNDETDTLFRMTNSQFNLLNIGLDQLYNKPPMETFESFEGFEFMQ